MIEKLDEESAYRDEWLNKANEEGKTPLHVAMTSGLYGVVKALIDRNVNLLALDKFFQFLTLTTPFNLSRYIPLFHNHFRFLVHL